MIVMATQCMVQIYMLRHPDTYPVAYKVYAFIAVVIVFNVFGVVCCAFFLKS